MPLFLPERFEAGTLPMPAISALSAGIDFVTSAKPAWIHDHDTYLFRLAEHELSKIRGLTIHNSFPGAILLVSAKNLPSEELASKLNEFGICVRAGFHCSPLAHKKLNTPSNGTCRISFGAFNTEAETKELCRAFKSILKYY